MKYLAMALAMLAILIGVTPASAQEAVPLKCNEPVEGKIVGIFELSGQYYIDVPAEATKLEVKVESLNTPPADIDLFAAFGKLAFIKAIDHERTGPGAVETIILTADGSFERRPDGSLRKISGEPGLQKPGRYYIVVGNPDEARENRFRLTATYYIDDTPCGPARCDPASIQLKANTAAKDKIAAKAVKLAVEEQYCLVAPAEAMLLALAVQGTANVNMYVRVGKPVEASGNIIIADYYLGSGKDQFIIIAKPQLKSGPHYIAVENPEGSEQEFSVIAIPVANIEEIKNFGTPVQGSIEAPLLAALLRYLQTDKGQLSLTQYKIKLPEKVKTLTIKLEGRGDKDLNLHLRHEKPVEIAGGRIVSDLSAISPAGTEIVAISGSLLKAGTYYIAIEGPKNTPQDFTLTVILDLGDGQQQTIEFTPRQ